MHTRVTAVAAVAFLYWVTTAASAADYTGFWKKVCTDAFGISIKPSNDKKYSVSFCGPGGCFAPGTWKPNTTIEGDPSYRIVDSDTLEVQVQKGGRWDRYKKCTSETNPKLDYSTMRGQPRPGGSGVRYKPYYQGIPDYEKMTVFLAEPASAHAKLREELIKAPVTPNLCVKGSVKATVVPPHELRTNICDPTAYSAIKSLLARLAPSLDGKRWTFRKVDLDIDGEPELIVEYIDLIGDADVKDPYLSLWHLSHNGTAYRPTYAGPFLVGSIHAQMAFGQVDKRQIVFVRHSSCTECHPWVYLTAVDFFRLNGAAFEFTYDKDHKSFKYDIEYVLPGKGHSVDAKVETRTLPATPGGPHLMQEFRLDDGKTEWWVFRCANLKCDYEMYDELPSKYRALWRSGTKL
jgi:hypothetical protein